MKKILSHVISAGLLTALLLPLLVSAQQPGPGDAPGWGDVDVMRVLGRITDWLFAILLIVAAIFIIVAGYYFVTAQGNPDTVARARQFVLYALIGVLVGFLAKGLVVMVDRIVRG
jgi:hypothetical protein